jgi:hypothetical protein
MSSFILSGKPAAVAAAPAALLGVLLSAMAFVAVVLLLVLLMMLLPGSFFSGVVLAGFLGGERGDSLWQIVRTTR